MLATQSSQRKPITNVPTIPVNRYVSAAAASGNGAIAAGLARCVAPVSGGNVIVDATAGAGTVAAELLLAD